MLKIFYLSINCQLDLFDKVINTILLYSCEVWSYENIDVIERMHLKFLKINPINLKSSTSDCMVVPKTVWYMEKLADIHCQFCENVLGENFNRP